MFWKRCLNIRPLSIPDSLESFLFKNHSFLHWSLTGQRLNNSVLPVDGDLKELQIVSSPRVGERLSSSLG